MTVNWKSTRFACNMPMEHAPVPISFCALKFRFGLGVPAGLFVPSLLSGAILGRFVGEVLQLLHSHVWTWELGFWIMGSSGQALRITFPVTIFLARVLDRACNWGTCISKGLEPSTVSKHIVCPSISRSWTKVVALLFFDLVARCRPRWEVQPRQRP